MKLIYIFIIISTIASCERFKNNSNQIPAFDLILDSLTHFNTEQIPSGSPIALIYFSPDCEHCLKETGDLLDHISHLQSVKFYFITNDSLTKIRSFLEYFKISRYSNIVVGRDYKYFFPMHFKSIAVPYLVVYDKHKTCRAVYPGEINATTLIDLVNRL